MLPILGVEQISSQHKTAGATYSCTNSQKPSFRGSVNVSYFSAASFMHDEGFLKKLTCIVLSYVITREPARHPGSANPGARST